MKFKELLEETYSRSISDKIYKEVIKPRNYGRNRYKKIDITKYFEKFLKKYKSNKKIFFKMIKMQSGSPERAYHDSKDSTIVFRPSVDRQIISRDSFFHEVVHAFDDIRRKDAPTPLPKKYLETSGGYFRDPSEFNALVNFIKTYKNRDKYKNIETKKDLLRFLARETKTSFNYLARENLVWYNKLLKRLAREKLLPKNFKH
tara:strand:- start:2696 stop:3301 length:606 start_codon:yes stop_codon:yes gene_type:complete